MRPAALALAVGLAVVSARASAQPALAYRLPGVAFEGPARPDAARPDTTRPPPPDLWLGRDKALHAGGSFLLTLSGQYVLVDKGGLSNGQALPLSAAAALGLGLLKEVADSRRPDAPLFSWRDLAADALGVTLAAAVASW